MAGRNGSGELVVPGGKIRLRHEHHDHPLSVVTATSINGPSGMTYITSGGMTTLEQESLKIAAAMLDPKEFSHLDVDDFAAYAVLLTEKILDACQESSSRFQNVPSAE